MTTDAAIEWCIAAIAWLEGAGTASPFAYEAAFGIRAVAMQVHQQVLDVEQETSASRLAIAAVDAARHRAPAEMQADAYREALSRTVRDAFDNSRRSDGV